VSIDEALQFGETTVDGVSSTGNGSGVGLGEGFGESESFLCGTGSDVGELVFGGLGGRGDLVGGGDDLVGSGPLVVAVCRVAKVVSSASEGGRGGRKKAHRYHQERHLLREDRHQGEKRRVQQREPVRLSEGQL
jgi:hypothetical protein